MTRIKLQLPFFLNSHCFRIWIPIVCKEIMKAFSHFKTSQSPIIPWSNQMINRDRRVLHKSIRYYPHQSRNLRSHPNRKYFKKSSNSNNKKRLSWCLVDSNIKLYNKNNFRILSYLEVATLLWWWIKTPTKYKLIRYFEEY